MERRYFLAILTAFCVGLGLEVYCLGLGLGLDISCLGHNTGVHNKVILARSRPVFRGGLRGLNPPPRKVYTKISGSTFLRNDHDS